MEVWGGIVYDKFSLIQVNHMLRVISISHFVDISYLVLYLISRHLNISIDATKLVTLFITYTHL